MKDIEKHEMQSEELQEVLGQIPGWIIRYGLSLIFLIFIGILIGSYLFKYPEVVSARLMLTTYNTPAPLEVKAGGQIECILVKDEQSVMEGQVVAVIKNTANFKDVFALEQSLNSIIEKKSWDQIVQKEMSIGMLALGDIQHRFTVFQKNWKEYKGYLDRNRLPQKIKLLKQQIRNQKEIFSKQKFQYNLHNRDLTLSKNGFHRDSILYCNGKIIATAEYERSKQSYIKMYTNLVGFEANMKRTELSIIKLEETILETKLQMEQENYQFSLSLDESLQLLTSEINKWKDKYVISSPIRGKITLAGYWSSNQIIRTGDWLATVIPEDETKIIAKAVINPINFGKVEKGQLVNIKLTGFPYMEFGMLKGVIKGISMVPGKDGYVAEIALTNGMTSTYKEQLKFVQEMDGTAEIVTKEMRLISRFFNPIRALFDNNM
ncbi:HlyD family efflux transporter periplasmic adaptor subunit [Halosquirtibacter laminarini]|uniref:HlyD family efflux transporter periplasmic adaptor subunit n=1 Tax=Halosquirtibacter laminarini TaxID=3374600 RepID=A0AC61NDI7_9BACT|nr:HlyD family efflux transporter periplasmic adaptor subunit [Prolixibacteraceae bacterium]